MARKSLVQSCDYLQWIVVDCSVFPCVPVKHKLSVSKTTNLLSFFGSTKVSLLEWSRTDKNIVKGPFTQVTDILCNLRHDFCQGRFIVTLAQKISDKSHQDQAVKKTVILWRQIAIKFPLVCTDNLYKIIPPKKIGQKNWPMYQHKILRFAHLPTTPPLPQKTNNDTTIFPLGQNFGFGGGVGGWFPSFSK